MRLLAFSTLLVGCTTAAVVQPSPALEDPTTEAIAAEEEEAPATIGNGSAIEADDTEAHELVTFASLDPLFATECDARTSCPGFDEPGTRVCLSAQLAPEEWVGQCALFCDEPVGNAACLASKGFATSPVWPKDAEKVGECLLTPAGYRLWQPAVDNCAAHGGHCVAAGQRFVCLPD